MVRAFLLGTSVVDEIGCTGISVDKSIISVVRVMLSECLDVQGGQRLHLDCEQATSESNEATK